MPRAHGTLSSRAASKQEYPYPEAMMVMIGRCYLIKLKNDVSIYTHTIELLDSFNTRQHVLVAIDGLRGAGITKSCF